MHMNDIDFLIIGAAKSATTTLQRSLVTDPDILMPRGDFEPHYFSREHHRGDAWYFSNFPEKLPGQLLGERSNSYLATPGVAERIYAALPHVKLIVQLRNPVDRAYSDYCMLFRRGEVSRDIEKYLDPRIAKDKRFLADGKYSAQLVAYRALFPASKLLVLLFEELKNDPVSQISKLRKYLGRSDVISTTVSSAKAKDKTVPVINPIFRRHLGWLKPLVAPVRGNKIVQSMRQLLVAEVEYPELQPEIRKRLTDYFAPEVENMQKLLGRRLPEW
jgi:Sulfotransferase domain